MMNMVDINTKWKTGVKRINFEFNERDAIDIDESINLWLQHHPDVLIRDIKYAIGEYRETALIIYDIQDVN